MKYYIIAGEASGDLHGARLIEALHREDPQAQIRCWGGDLMQAGGATLVKHYRDLAFMGFWEVVRHLKTILNNLRFCQQDIRAFAPDVIIYIDYPGFNLRIADWAKKQGFKNHYYISPQLWAWKENRIVKIKKNIDALYVILPFEKTYFETQHQFPVHYVGHPLLDSLAHSAPTPDFIQKHQLDPQKKIIALLHGSRKQEIKKMLPYFLACMPSFGACQFVVAGAPGIDPSWYRTFLKNQPCKLVHNQTYALLQHSQAAVVTSGTATLETALLDVPQVVCYRSSYLSYWIAKRVVKLDAIALVNLILKKHLITELIQNDCTPQNITKNLHILLSKAGRKSILEGYQSLRTLLDKGGASKTTARLIVSAIKP